MGYKKQTIKGVSWVGFFRLTSRVVALLKTMVLARLFSPLQFGVFGIASLVLAFLEIITETGINIFIVQTKEKVEDFIDTAWVVSILRGLIIASIVFLSAPFVADFFNSKESQNIIMLIAVVPLIRGFINPSKSLFQKNLDFNKEFYLQGTLLLVDAIVSIILSLLTKDISALAYGLIASALLEVYLTFKYIKPNPRLNFDYDKAKEIYHKGKWVTLSGFTQYIAENADNIAVGKFLNTSQLGLYQVAYRISTLTITEVTDVISRVFFPLYAKINDDKKRLKNAFLKSTGVLSFVVIPIGLIFFFFPKEVIYILLGEKWIMASEVLRVLAFYGVLRSIVGYPSSLFLGLGLQKYVAFMTTLRGIVLLVTVLPLLFAYGVIGVAYSAVLSVLAELPLVLYLLFRIFKK